MKQNTLKPTPGAKKDSKRVGRGRYRGTYSGRGMKGQKARTGGGVRPGFEGGQTPLIRRIPKLKGFKNPNRIEYFPLNLNKLDIFEDGANVDVKALVEKSILKKEMPVKLLGSGELSKKLTITVDSASQSAIKKVEKAGGKVVLPEDKKGKVKAKKEEEKES
ncbi:50S ribosomal protein L15 [Patescibacteria group bacterium]|nr:50S ribosomal protein L15 [Patescibacteria group bacterium]